MIKTLLVVSTVVLLSNCASSNPDSGLTSTDVSQLAVVCTKEKPLGSRIPVTTCRSKQQIENEREDARALLRQSNFEFKRGDGQ